MKNAIILSLLVVIALLALDRRSHGEAQAMIQDTKADFPSCTTIHNGPIQRPDVYSATPHGRKADVA